MPARCVFSGVRTILLGAAALLAIACGEPQSDAVLFELEAAPATDARLSSLLRRELSRPPEVAALLFQMHAVADRLARLARARARDPEVASFAQESVDELASLHANMRRNCTMQRAESTYYELVGLRGQDVFAELSRDTGRFEQRYLFSLATLGAEFLSVLDNWVSPRAAPGETQAASFLRSTLWALTTRAETLLASLPEPPGSEEP